MQLRAALSAPSPSERLQAALDAGTRPNPDYVADLIDRCGVEPDFYVRDMLTWALTRHPAAVTVPLLLTEIRDHDGQSRSQALHTLSKIGDPAGWSVITPELLRDPNDEEVRTAWRAAVVLVPDDARDDLAQLLATQLGRGGRDVQLSLSRALAALGDASRQPLVDARENANPQVRLHALATERQLEDPDEGFDESVFEARRIIARGTSAQE